MKCQKAEDKQRGVVFKEIVSIPGYVKGWMTVFLVGVCVWGVVCLCGGVGVICEGDRVGVGGGVCNVSVTLRQNHWFQTMGAFKLNKMGRMLLTVLTFVWNTSAFPPILCDFKVYFKFSLFKSYEIIWLLVGNEMGMLKISMYIQ